VLIYAVIPRNGMFKDPVCNMMVDEKKAKFISEVGGRKAYLCSATCKSEFDSNPKKYGY
jgi:YHS domain-containing protein